MQDFIYSIKLEKRLSTQIMESTSFFMSCLVRNLEQIWRICSFAARRVKVKELFLSMVTSLASKVEKQKIYVYFHVMVSYFCFINLVLLNIPSVQTFKLSKFFSKLDEFNKKEFWKKMRFELRYTNHFPTAI